MFRFLVCFLWGWGVSFKSVTYIQCIHDSSLTILKNRIFLEKIVCSWSLPNSKPTSHTVNYEPLDKCGSIPGRGRHFLSAVMSRPDVWSTQSLIEWYPSFFSRVGQSSPLTSAYTNVKNAIQPSHRRLYGTALKLNARLVFIRWHFIRHLVTHKICRGYKPSIFQTQARLKNCGMYSSVLSTYWISAYAKHTIFEIHLFTYEVANIKVINGITLICSQISRPEQFSWPSFYLFIYIYKYIYKRKSRDWGEKALRK